MTTAKNEPTIRRAPRDTTNPYFMARRKTAQDRTLSFEARGVLMYLLSRPDDWTIQPSDLQREGNCGRDRVKSILKELEDHGYLSRYQPVDPDKKTFRAMVYYLYEEPVTEKPSTAEPLTENPLLTEDRRSTEYENVQKTIAPTARREKKPSFPAVTMTPMKDAIASAFGWTWDTMTGVEKGQVQKAAYELLAAGATADAVPRYYHYCAETFDQFGPMALASNKSKADQRHTPAPSRPLFEADVYSPPDTPSDEETVRAMQLQILGKEMPYGDGY